MFQQKNWLQRVLIAAALAQAGMTAHTAKADEYDDLRARWAARAGYVNTSDPDVIAQNQASGDNAQVYWDAMDRSQGRTALWPDLSDWTVSASVTATFTRLNALASAYLGGNANLKNNPDVLAAVIAGVEWMFQNHYTLTMTTYDNWWDWQIGAPSLINTMVYSLYNILTPVQRDNWLALVDHYVPDPTRKLNPDGTFRANFLETGANLLDKCWIVVFRGMLGKNSERITTGKNAISSALAYVPVNSTGTLANGFYADGSFIQHENIAYVGNYGNVLVSDIARMYYLLKDSSWDITDPNKGNVFNWAMQSFRPFIYDGGMMDMQRGRMISNQYATDHRVGRGNVTTLLALEQALPDEQALQIKSVLKGWVQRDTTFGSSYFTPQPTAVPGVMATMSGSDITRLKEILNDDSIPAAAEAQETRVYTVVDRVLQRRPGYAFGVSMFSKRISAFENGNGQNLRGWWTGMGMTNLYNADQMQYGGNYWATVDMLRLPGTTTDHSEIGQLTAWGDYYNTKAGIGGAELNKQFAVAAMDFATKNVTGSLLVGKKAWFMLGDKMVAVGASISTTDGKSVETIVDNRKLAADGNNVLTVNGVTKDSFIPWSESISATSWAHLAGTVAGSDIGYVFPDAPTVKGLREQRAGAWSNVDANGDPTQVVDNYLSLAIDHGINPSAKQYTYIVLPNRSAEQTAAFAANTGLSVLSRDATATAVKDSSQGVTGVVFWNDASKTVNANGSALATCDKKAVLLMQQNGTDLQLAVSDPTQLNTGAINLEINRPGTALVSADPGITVTQLSPTIKMQLAVNGSAGKSFSAHFTLNGTTTLSATDDAYVRDGTYASTNYGTAGTITIKNADPSFTRDGLLKFDLSGIEGTISSAVLHLVPVNVGMTGIVHNVYQTTDDSWNETSVNWNNQPADGALVASFTVPAVNTDVTADITSAASNVMSGSKKLSLRIEASQNFGPNGSVDYASRTHSTTAYRPTLVVTVQ